MRTYRFKLMHGLNYWLVSYRISQHPWLLIFNQIGFEIIDLLYYTYIRYTIHIRYGPWWSSEHDKLWERSLWRLSFLKFEIPKWQKVDWNRINQLNFERSISSC